ncbi:zinc-binding alcohol dehydrogenase family protein [Acidipropionibacterium virtanenii]|uniref:Zinc-type alcohol dehydrogenase-like protein n=1 Tax=Acidipropionibacterium virtanenii TaxID=2057246 RepID=A0A344USU3_9ACTN|nr:zinc-binding alcohol dehydrogenase family protein [Acidipropionibacterium virtanenii]AXE38341.1 Zinc-type alcohol dehydrogenase-like protein [Acidipropionibacterium virtanenii]
MTRTQAIGYTTNLPATDPDALVTHKIDAPEPGPHDLLVEVRAVSVNPVDVKQRVSAPADGFAVLGYDAAGVVRETGAGVTLFAPGDEVFYAGTIDRPGTNQQLHVVDERIVGRKPRSLSFADAASLPLTSITAWETLFDRLRLTEDSRGTLLVVGATGGVGSAILQLAEALLPDVTVIATASNAERTAWVEGLGAERVVDHHQDLAAQVLEVAPGGVDWLFTAHSEGQIPLYAQIVRPFGHIVAIDDGSRDIGPLKGRSIAWHWELMFTRPLQRTPDMVEQHRLLNQVADLVDAGRLRATTTTALTPISPETLREAHRLVESGRTMGKVVLHDWA